MTGWSSSLLLCLGPDISNYAQVLRYVWETNGRVKTPLIAGSGVSSQQTTCNCWGNPEGKDLVWILHNFPNPGLYKVLWTKRP